MRAPITRASPAVKLGTFRRQRRPEPVRLRPRLGVRRPFGLDSRSYDHRNAATRWIPPTVVLEVARTSLALQDVGRSTFDVGAADPYRVLRARGLVLPESSREWQSHVQAERLVRCAVHRLLARPVEVNLDPRPADDDTDPDIAEHSIGERILFPQPCRLDQAQPRRQDLLAVRARRAPRPTPTAPARPR